MNTPYDLEMHFLRGRRQAYNDSIRRIEEELRQLKYEEVRVDVELQGLEFSRENFLADKQDGAKDSDQRKDSSGLDRDSETMPKIDDDDGSVTVDDDGEVLSIDSKKKVDGSDVNKETGERDLVDEVGDAAQAMQVQREKEKAEEVIERGSGFGAFDKTMNNDPTTVPDKVETAEVDAQADKWAKKEKNYGKGMPDDVGRR